MLNLLAFFFRCRVVFYDKFHGCLHYLHHLMLFMDEDLSYEPSSTKDHQPCLDCGEIFRQMRDAINHFSMIVNFGRDLPDILEVEAAADQLLTFIHEDSEEEMASVEASKDL